MAPSLSLRRYGSLLLLVAAPSVLPGIGSLAAPLAGAAGMALGLQLALGRPEPWVPQRAQAWLDQKGPARRLLRRIKRFFGPVLRLRSPRMPLLLAGAAVVWTSFVLLLPLAVVPLSNTIPSLALGLLGAGLALGRALLTWLGLALSGAFTGAVALLGAALWEGLRALLERLP